MEFLKAILGDKYSDFEAAIAAYNEQNPDNEVNIVNGAADITPYKQEIERLKAENERAAKTYSLTAALKEAGVRDPEYVIYKKGGVESFSFDKKGKPLGINEALRELKANNNLEHLFANPRVEYNPVGGTANPNINPFSADSLNLTEQGRLYRENPEQARALAAAAGRSL